MKLEVEYDQLKHQLSPVHQKASTSPGTMNDEHSWDLLDHFCRTFGYSIGLLFLNE